MSVVTMTTKIMPPPAYSLMTENSLGEFNTCIQQANSPYSSNHRTTTATHLKSPLSTCSSIVDEEEQIKRNKLIQAATNRLRQKKLEIQFQAMMAQVVEVQCQLDIIKMEASTSLQLLPSSDISEAQLAHFEKRLAHHQVDLKHVLHCKQEDKTPIEKKPAPSPPSLASTISSLLSIYSKSDSKDNVMVEQESDYSILGGSIHHHKKRRNKRHDYYNQQKKQHGVMQSNVPTASSLLDTSTITSYTASIPITSSSDVSGHYNESVATGSPYFYDDCSDDNNSILVQPLHQESNNTDPGKRNELLVLHSIYQPAVQVKEQDRNVLDDVLSFINDLASDCNSHNDAFIQDIHQILDQEQLQYHLPQQASARTVTAAAEPKGSVFYALKYLIGKGLKWIKFAIVMTLAIMINLKKGPKSFL